MEYNNLYSVYIFVKEYSIPIIVVLTLTFLTAIDPKGQYEKFSWWIMQTPIE